MKIFITRIPLLQEEHEVTDTYQILSINWFVLGSRKARTMWHVKVCSKEV